VAETPSHTWPCPSCGRRVPLRAPACHCGMTRARAEELAAAAPAPAGRTLPTARGRRLPTLPRDVRTLVVCGALVIVAGFVWLAVGPRRPSTGPAVLGYVDSGPPPPPSPPPRPPFKLPWWK
jgi:hypothetical protein